MAKIEMSTTKWTVRSTFRKRNQLNFDLAIQRKGNNWDNEKQSLYIHSHIFGYPTPLLFVIEQSESAGEKLKNPIFHLADGKQRTSTLIQFLEDGFKLHDNTPSYIDNEGNEVEIAGKLYSELPEEIQTELNDSNLSVAYLKNIDEDEVEEMFFRLNNGVPLSKIEMTRAKAGSDIMNFINSVSEMPFFSNTISLTSTMRKRFVDQELILQILQYIIDGSTDFSGKNIQQFAIDMRKENGITEEYQNQIIDTAKYLAEALPDNIVELKKLHVPMIFNTAMQAIEDEINPEKFGGWVQLFLNHKPSAYTSASGAGTAKADRVATRYKEMLKHYTNNINEVSDYVKPVIKESGRKKGRPSKVTVLEVKIQPEETVEPEVETVEPEMITVEPEVEESVESEPETEIIGELFQDAV